MRIVFHIVEVQSKPELKGNWRLPDFKCEIDAPAQALLKGLLLPHLPGFIWGPSLSP